MYVLDSDVHDVFKIKFQRIISFVEEFPSVQLPFQLTAILFIYLSFLCCLHFTGSDQLDAREMTVSEYNRACVALVFFISNVNTLPFQLYSLRVQN